MSVTALRWALDAGLLVGLAGVLGIVVLVDGPEETQTVEGGDDRVVIGKQEGTLFSPGKTIYGDRVAKNRAKKKEFVEKGLTTISERAVDDGLDWLARHQGDDGSWKDSHLRAGGLCRGAPCRSPASDYAMAQTGLALLAFQAGGHFDFNTDSKYRGVVRKGLDYLVKNQRDDGGLYQHSGNHYMYEHGMAAFALCEACALARAFDRKQNDTYRRAATKAVKFIEQEQHNDGGWRYSSSKSSGSDTSVSGWQVLALKTALNAKIEVHPDVLAGGERFFRGCEMRRNGRTGYTDSSGQITEATTGVGMLVHQFLLKTPRSNLCRDAASFLADYAEQTWREGRAQQPDYYLWYNCTLAMFQNQGPEWKRWNAVVRDHVISLQVPGEGEQCDRGSWPPNPSKWGSQGGRVYTTALAVLTLEVYYRFADVVKEE